MPFIPTTLKAHLTWLAKRVVTHRQKMKNSSTSSDHHRNPSNFLVKFTANLKQIYTETPKKLNTSKSKIVPRFFIGGEKKKISIVNSVTDLWIKSQCPAFKKKKTSQSHSQEKRFLILHWSVITLNSNQNKIASNSNWIQ